MIAKRFLLAVVLVPVAALAASACTIPVFRYALERWELTAYEFVVFHDGPLDDAATQVMRKVAAGPPAANVRFQTIDVAKDVPKFYKPMYERFGKGRKLPWVALRASDAEAKAPPAWTGPLDEAALRPVIASPARQKIVDRLKIGETAVFVLLESGDAAADEKVRDVLTKELARLEKSLQLPEQSEEGPQLRTGLPLKVGFTVLPLKRDDAAEREFIEILFSTEEDLDKVKGPIVLPIFGRGRLLCSMYQEDIVPKQIQAVARFLCSECSCQVKELNPGVDLLIPADWRDLLEKAGPPANPRPDTPEPKTRKK